MIFQVGRKVSLEDEALKSLPAKDRAKWDLAYRVGNLEDPVFVHAKSVFALKKRTEPAPEWLVYQEVFETAGKMFMRGVTAVEPEWLPVFGRGLCNFLPPVSDPEPWYDADKGVIMCRRTGTFGLQAWPLPLLDLPYPEESEECVKLFARFLLEGKVFQTLGEFSGVLLCRPATFCKSTSFHTAPVKAFINALSKKAVWSRDRLLGVMKEQPDYLKAEFKALVPKARAKKVDDVWKELKAE